MTQNLQSNLAAIEKAAAEAGLTLASVSQGKDFVGRPTSILQLALQAPLTGDGKGRALRLELSESFALDKPELLPQMKAHLANEAKRLHNPNPQCYVTMTGLPLVFDKFEWPVHRETSGSDTFIVHGEIHLAGDGARELHARIAASVTLTFAEIVPSMEQPYAETFVYNAVRKTADQGQIEFLKSGNRQPVPVTTRFYSRWQNQFVFNETNDAERLEYLLSKVYWLSGVLGGSAPVWIADPRDAQYLNTTAEELLRAAGHESGEGLMKLDGEFAAATPALMAKAAEFQARLEAALDFSRPKFNEAMRAGTTKTNM